MENPRKSAASEEIQRGMNRRQMVQRLFGGAGAALALPGVAAAHPIHELLTKPGMLEAADEQAAAAQWSPLFFDPHQNETFVVLAEEIIPGSTQAQVNRFVDLLLSVDSTDNQKKFVAALSAFDAEALKRHIHPFKDLTAEQQNQILTDASTHGSRAPEGLRHRHGPALPKEESSPSPEQALRDNFETLKGWVSGAYYSSEIGMRELGWDGNYFYQSFPGCQHPEEQH